MRPSFYEKLKEGTRQRALSSSALKTKANYAKAANQLKWRADSARISQYDDNAGQYREYSRIYFTYNSKEQVIEFIESDVEDDGSIIPYAKYQLSYDGSGSMTSVTTFRYDTTFKAYFPGSRTRYIYVDNLLNEELDEEYNVWSASFVPNYRSTYTYNTDYLLSSITSSFFQEFSNQWVETTKREYYYNANKQNIEIRGYELYGSDWTLVNKADKIYANGFLVERIDSTKFSTSSPRNRDEYFYDLNGNQISIKEYIYTQGIYEKYAEIETQFNLNVVKDDVIFPTVLWYNELFPHYDANQLLSQEYRYISSSPESESRDNILFFYNQVESNPNSISEPSNISSTLHIYPNPSTDKIQLKAAPQDEYIIIDASGRQIEKGPVNLGTLNIGHLQNGLYTLVCGQARAVFVKE